VPTLVLNYSTTTILTNLIKLIVTVDQSLHNVIIPRKLFISHSGVLEWLVRVPIHYSTHYNTNTMDSYKQVLNHSCYQRLVSITQAHTKD